MTHLLHLLLNLLFFSNYINNIVNHKMDAKYVQIDGTESLVKIDRFVVVFDSSTKKSFIVLLLLFIILAFENVFKFYVVIFYELMD